MPRRGVSLSFLPWNVDVNVHPTTTLISIQTAGLEFGGTGQCSYREVMMAVVQSIQL